MINTLEILRKATQGNLHKQLDETNEKLQSKIVELHLAMNYLTSILNHMAQGILFIGLDGTITTYNAIGEKLLGKDNEKVLFNIFWDNFSDNFFGFSMRRALETTQVPLRSFISLNRQELEINTTFVFEEADKEEFAGYDFSKGLIILIRDITEIRRLELIANRNDRLKELGEMAALMAHEIRNPLGGIKGFASLLVRDLHDHPPQQQMAKYIVEGTDNLNRLVTNILNYSRPMQLKCEPTDLNTLAYEVSQLVSSDPAFNPNITICVETEEKPSLYPVDSQLLKSALLNLVINAAQAIPIEGTIRIIIARKEQEMLIEVKDTGIGIPPENLEKIFSPHFTTKSQGFGFGLAEVHRIILAHEGTIEVRSVVGEGSLFSIRLPSKESSL